MKLSLTKIVSFTFIILALVIASQFYSVLDSSHINKAFALDASDEPGNPISSGDYKFDIGDSVYTTSSLNVRSSPSTQNSTIITTVPSGTRGRVTSGPILASGHMWWFVSYDSGKSGWSSETYLEKDTSTTPTTPTVTVSNFALGDNIITTTAVNLRSGPSTGSAFIRTIPEGTKGKIVLGPAYGSGYTWWYIIYSDAILGGWSAEPFIEKDTSDIPGEVPPGSNTPGPSNPGTPVPTDGPTSVPTLSLTADPSSIDPGEKSTLTLTAKGTESCRFTPYAWSNTGIIGSDGVLRNTNVVSPTVSTTYTATCSNSVGQTTKSVTVSVSIPQTTNPPTSSVPAPTSAPTLTGSAGSCGTGQVNLSWTSVPGATSYQIFRGGVNSGVWKTVTGTSYSYVDPVIPEGWRYDVRAVNSAGVGPLSNPTTGVGVSTAACTTTTTTPPPNTTTPPVTTTQTSAPTVASTLTGSAGECGTGRVNLSWTSVPNATAYQIFRGGFNTGVWQTVTGTSYSYVDPVIPEGWRYDVRAINSAGNGPLSNPTTGVGVSTSACTTTTTAVAPTITLKVNDSTSTVTVPSNTSVKISWTSTGSPDGCHLNNLNSTTNTNNSIANSGTWYTPGLVVDADLIINCNNQVKSNTASIRIGSTPAPLVTLYYASPSTISSGQSSTLYWYSTNATKCNFADSPTVAYDPTGTRRVTPTTSTTYTLSCSGAGGTTITHNAQVLVTAPTTVSYQSDSLAQLTQLASILQAIQTLLNSLKGGQ